MAILVPFGDQNDGLRFLQGRLEIGAMLYVPLPRRWHRTNPDHRVMYEYMCTIGEEAFNDRDRGRFANIVGVRLERQTQNQNRPTREFGDMSPQDPEDSLCSVLIDFEHGA